MLSIRWLNIGKQFLKQHIVKTAFNSRELQTGDQTGDIKIDENDANEKENRKLDPKDRSREISVETSIEYLKSSAFFKAYGNELVWKLYRRNFKGVYPPKTRRTCIRGKRISTGSPCPICRDEYLVVDYRNIELLKQFISPYDNNVLPSKKTGLCQMQHRNLLVAIKKARNYGFLTFEVPHRFYNYSLYLPKL